MIGTFRRRIAVGVITVLAALLLAPISAHAALTSPVLIVAAHPDDETLMASVTIAEHGAQDVHVLWLTRGTGSNAVNIINGATVSPWWGVRHDPIGEGYQPLTPTTMGAARIVEATTAARCLTAGLGGSLTLHEAGLIDGQVTQAAAADAIRAVADQIAPGGAVRIKAHSHLVDNHPDHVATGRAARQLQAEDPARWGDVRHYVLPPYWTDSRLAQVTESWDTPASADVSARVVAATRSYGAWAPYAGAYAIGYHSVAGMLDALATTPRSMVHP